MTYFTCHDLLQSLPLKEQRALMAQHAEMVLSQSSLRSQSRSGSATSLSQPSSRRTSVSLEDDDTKRPELEEEDKLEKRGRCHL